MCKLSLTALLLIRFGICFHTIITEAVGNMYSDKEFRNIDFFNVVFFKVAEELVLWISVFLLSTR